LRSIRSCNRARTTERGFALLWAIGLAVLFFMLIQLILIESAQELTEAQRFRSRIVAMVLAENGAELAAKGIKDSNYTIENDQDWQGKISGRMSKNNETGDFKIYATGETAGVKPVKAEVEVQGNITGGKVRIDFTKHKP
jgi:hypothetical protein